MSKILSTLILILLFINTSAQDTVQSYSLIILKDCLILNKDSTPFTGVAVQERIFSRKAKSIIKVQFGTKNGFHKDYYRNGQLKYEGFYNGGGQDGVQYEYYKNGNPSDIYEMSLSTYHGKSLCFSKKGKLTSIDNNIYGQQTGSITYFRKRGTEKFELETLIESGKTKIKINANEDVSIIGEHLNGKEHGTWKYYDKNGKCFSTTEYENGKKIYEKFID